MKEIEMSDREREHQVLTLRTLGWRYGDIARELHYPDERSVAHVVRMGLQRYDVGSAAENVALEDLRLGALLRAWVPAALAGDKDAALIVLRVHAARVKLHGLAQPSKIAVSHQEESALDASISELLRDLSAPALIPPTADAGEDWSELMD